MTLFSRILSPVARAVALTSLVALAPIASFATPLFSITETTGDLFELSPDLQAIAAVVSQGSFPAFGADAHHLNVELLFAYDFAAATSLQSPEPAGETGVNYLIAAQFSEGGTPIVEIPADIDIYSDVTGGSRYATILALPELPSSDVIANITGPAGLSAPLYFIEESSSVPDNGVSSVWLLVAALMAIHGATRCRLMRAG